MDSLYIQFAINYYASDTINFYLFIKFIYFIYLFILFNNNNNNNNNNNLNNKHTFTTCFEFYYN